MRIAFVIVFISTRLFRMCAIAFTYAANLMNSHFGALPQIHCWKRVIASAGRILPFAAMRSTAKKYSRRVAAFHTASALNHGAFVPWTKPGAAAPFWSTKRCTHV